MGDQDVRRERRSDQQRLFMKCVLKDLRALEQMLAEGRIESDMTRIGAEQELFLVDDHWRPARKALDVLAVLDDPDFTTELGLFNLEFNLPPYTFSGDCLRKLEHDLNRGVDRARAAAVKCGADVVMVGILPTIQLSDLDYDAITPLDRYYALNDALMELRGGAFEFRLVGKDELLVQHDNLMVEACNTSFQIHFQVQPDEFAHCYNIAQFLSGPVLAACTNSPLLFGQRLWKETRIGLFQQAVDTRSSSRQAQERPSRVSFGSHWVRESALEIFKEDITRFRTVLDKEIDEDPVADLAAGRAPKLTALRLHNGTVYRWNRPCYGVVDGHAHLRIENRYLPAGPSTLDEVANAAFWFGLMTRYQNVYDDISRVFDFSDAKANFVAATREGLRAQFRWFDRDSVPAQDLILEQLLPHAAEGLGAAGIDPADIARYIGIIESRVGRGQTGSGWLLHSLAAMKDQGTKGERMAALTEALVKHQRTGIPVHEWPSGELKKPDRRISMLQKVETMMTTDVFTVSEDEVIDLVASVMDWRHIRHVPVEDNAGKLVGLVSYRNLLRVLSRDIPSGRQSPVPVHSIMRRNVITASPGATVAEAIQLMRTNRVACLPIVKGDHLVGIVTEHDFMELAAQLLDDLLKEEQRQHEPRQHEPRPDERARPSDEER